MLEPKGVSVLPQNLKVLGEVARCHAKPRIRARLVDLVIAQDKGFSLGSRYRPPDGPPYSFEAPHYRGIAPGFTALRVIRTS